MEEIVKRISDVSKKLKPLKQNYDALIRANREGYYAE
jgi:hypothetical protein